jgi:glycosyltransferase involved in cell wall biosynthesis
MRLLIAIPVLNEARTLATVIGSLPQTIQGVREKVVLVVDDGSTDESALHAREAGAQVVRHDQTRGVGAAFHSAHGYFLDGPFDLMVSIDADGQFNAADVPRLLAPILRGEADAVTANRFGHRHPIPHMSGVKRWGNRMMARLVSALAGQNFQDVSCGFRAFSRRALTQVQLRGAFTHTQEMLLQLSAAKMRIAEVPVEVRYFPDRKSRVAGNIPRYAFKTLAILLGAHRTYFPRRLVDPSHRLPGRLGGRANEFRDLQAGRASPVKDRSLQRRAADQSP